MNLENPYIYSDTIMVTFHCAKYLVAIPYNANIKTKHKISIRGSNMRSVNCLVSYVEARKQKDVFMVLYLACSYTLGY